MTLNNKWASAFLTTALTAVLAPAYLHLPGAMQSVSLDFSWNGALSYFSANELQFGKDVIFTFGPLGYLYSVVYAGYLLETKFLGSVAIALAIAWMPAVLVKRSRSAIFSLLVLYAAIAFGRFQLEAAILATIAAAACFAIRPEASRAALFLAGALLGFFSLQKFTFLLLALAGAGIVTLFFAARKDAARAAAMPAGLILAALALWIAAHQQLGTLADFFLASLDVALGYSHAMYGEAKTSLLWFGLSELAIVAAMVAAMVVYAPRKDVAAARAAVLLAALFLAWKQGFVRADYSHVICLFFAAQYLSVLIYVLGSSDPEPQSAPRLWARRERLVLALLAVSGVFVSYGGLNEVSRFPAFQSMFSLNQGLEGMWRNGWKLTHYGEYAASLEGELRESKRRHELPQIKALVGKQPVDVFGDDIGIALVNDLNYRPRPAFQSYTAYTPYLLDRNRAFYLSARAPRYVLVKYQTIDERLPSQSDSKTLEVILSGYRPAASERGFTLWERKGGNWDMGGRKLAHKGEASIGQTIALPARERGEIQWLAIHVDLSLLGKLRSFLYQPPEIRLRLVAKKGQAADFRLVRPLAREGFVVNPPLRGEIDLLNFLQDRQSDEITSFEVTIAGKNRALVASRFRYEVFSSAKPAYGPLPSGLWRAFYPLQSEPLEIEAANYPRIYTVSDKEVLFAHAPSRLSFRVPAAAREIAGRYGVMPGAFSGDRSGRSVDFTVEQAGKSGKIVLFSQAVKDSDERFFQVPIPESARGEVIDLTANCRGDCAGGWSYWSDVGFR